MSYSNQSLIHGFKKNLIFYLHGMIFEVSLTGCVALVLIHFLSIFDYRLISSVIRAFRLYFISLSKIEMVRRGEKAEPRSRATNEVELKIPSARTVG